VSYNCQCTLAVDGGLLQSVLEVAVIDLERLTFNPSRIGAELKGDAVYIVEYSSVGLELQTGQPWSFGYSEGFVTCDAAEILTEMSAHRSQKERP